MFRHMAGRSAVSGQWSAVWSRGVEPEGGAEGGGLVFQGTPEALVATPGASLTARYLRAALSPAARHALAEA